MPKKKKKKWPPKLYVWRDPNDEDCYLAETSLDGLCSDQRMAVYEFTEVKDLKIKRKLT